MSPVFSVFGRLGGSQPDPAQVEKWISEGRAFRYSFSKSQPYVPQSPDQTESSKSGDCKAKSLWLASKMDTRKVRFVIGKFKRGAAQSHAWLIWNARDGWLILDATMFSRSLDAGRVSQNEFIPIYSYAPGWEYTHGQAAAPKESKLRRPSLIRRRSRVGPKSNRFAGPGRVTVRVHANAHARRSPLRLHAQPHDQRRRPHPRADRNRCRAGACNSSWPGRGRSSSSIRNRRAPAS